MGHFYYEKDYFLHWSSYDSFGIAEQGISYIQEHINSQ